VAGVAGVVQFGQAESTSNMVYCLSSSSPTNTFSPAEQKVIYWSPTLTD